MFPKVLGALDVSEITLSEYGIVIFLVSGGQSPPVVTRRRFPTRQLLLPTYQLS
jgi:hypothetical protein